MTNPPVLRRDCSRRVLGGVCAGLARSFTVDPILIRAALIVATAVTGGWALLVYLVFWIVMPGDRAQRPGRWSPRRTLATLLALVVLLGVFLPDRTGTIGLLILFGVAVTWLLVTRLDRRQRQQQERLQGPAQWQQPPMREYQRHAVAASPAAGYQPRWPGATPTLRRSHAGRRMLMGTLLGWAALGVLALLGIHLGAIAFPAVALAAAGVALTSTARPRPGIVNRRPTGVIVLGLVAALVTVSMLLADRPASSTDSLRHYTSASELPRTLDLGVGTHTVDLSDLVLDRDTHLTIAEDAGSLTVILPSAGRVRASYSVDVGSMVFHSGGLRDAQGMDLSASETLRVAEDGPTLTLGVQLDIGQLEVRQ